MIELSARFRSYLNVQIAKRQSKKAGAIKEEKVLLQLYNYNQANKNHTKHDNPLIMLPHPLHAFQRERLQTCNKNR
jgi:hypothetical protein